VTNSFSSIEALYDLFQQYPHVATDSRKVAEGDIFFALKGDNFDGNLYVSNALEAGASAAVTDNASAVISERCLLVEDSLAALQRLAAMHRRRLGIPIIAITGTNGKTTTKELVSAVLSRRYRTVFTLGNLNNHIGVPLTLLSMDSSTRMGVVEMGASAQGEIAFLCSLAAPDYGLITNIGRAHLEGFGGVEGIRKGKGELYDFLTATGGMAFYCSDDPVLSDMVSERKGLRATAYRSSLADGMRNNLVGDYNRYNIAAAVAVGEYFDVPDDDIRAAVSAYSPDNNRSQATVTQRNLLTVDCYNANPSSMAAAIDNFAAEKAEGYPHKIMILGDMLELGDWSAEEHARIVEKALGSDAEKILLVGAEFGATPASDPRITKFENTAALADRLSREPFSSSFVLIKGSRGIGLEKAIPLF